MIVRCHRDESAAGGAVTGIDLSHGRDLSCESTGDGLVATCGRRGGARLVGRFAAMLPYAGRSSVSVNFVPHEFTPLDPLPTREPLVADDRVWRSVELTLAVILLVVLAPLLLCIALAISLFDPGPALFAHQRIGRNNRPFACYKFRTMVVGAQARLDALLAADPALRVIWERDQKLPKDPRVTRIGAFLRLTSLDELPQLFNVLRGEMSLVGPRPIVSAEVPRYGRYISYYYSLRPGLTGLWQVSGRSSTSYRRRVAADVHYARARSAKLDVAILAATLPAVVTGRGSC